MTARQPRSEPATGRTGALPKEVQELVEPRPPLGVPVPAYDGRSLPNVTASVVRALGGETDAAAAPALAGSLDPFRGARAEGPVLLWLVDGLGYERLRAACEGPASATLRGWFDRSRPITTVFPSTTTAALASLSTAAAPSRTGVVGYRQFLPRFGAVVDMLRCSPWGVAQDDALVGPAWSPSLLLGVPTVFREGAPGSVAVSRDRFERRAFTRAIYDGAEYAPYSTGSDLADALSRALRRPGPPALVLGYWDELDAVEHLRGPAAASADLELERLTGVLDFVARAVGPNVAKTTTVLVTGDHGLVPADPTLQTHLDAEPDIVRLLARPPTGDRRSAFLRARPGALDHLEEALRRRLPAGARVVRAEAALRHGLFGPPPFHEDLAEAVADLLVLLRSPGGIDYTLPGRDPGHRALLGAHGGLEPEELVVPLVAGPLDAFSARGSSSG